MKIDEWLEMQRKLNIDGENEMHDFINDPRFVGIEKFDRKVWLSSPTMHGDEQRWAEAFEFKSR